MIQSPKITQPPLPHPDQWVGHISYSCCGEDLFVLSLFNLMGIKKPSYLDIGSHNPFNISNTALMYSRDSRGFNVEANPHLMDAFYLYRQEDMNINVGIGLEEGIKTFYMWDDFSGRNTFSEDASKKMEVMTKTIQLPVTTINKLVETYCGNYPDFLSMDIEGMDYEVLLSADFSKSRPKVICVEAHVNETDKFVNMMASKDYFPAGRIAMDLIFVRKDFVELCGIP